MTINFGSYGLDYTHELCLAIERYTASAVRHESQAYVYRGMQLRYAVERMLYIQCINSEALFRHYLARLGVVSPGALPTLKPVESDISFFLCDQCAGDNHPRRRPRQWFMEAARRAYGWLSRRRPRARLKQMPVQGHEILIHVVNAKFANYLTPVTRELAPGSYAYLATSELGLREQLAQRGLPVVSVPTEGPLHQLVFCSYALSYFRQLMYDADATLNALRVLNPRCVLVVEGNAPMDVITAEASKLVGIPCYCVQQGWSPYVHSGFRNMNFTEMFVWGQRFGEMLQQQNPEQFFRAMGSHAVQRAHNRLPRDRVEVLSFFLQAPCALLGDEGYDAFIGLIVDVARLHDSLRVVVRSHPGYPLPQGTRLKLESCENVHFSEPLQESIAEVIAESDLVVSVFSTVLLEAMAMQVVPIICSIGALQTYYPNIADAGAAIEVHSVAEARSAINALIAQPSLLAVIRYRIGSISESFFCEGDAAQKIARQLQQAANMPGGMGGRN